MKLLKKIGISLFTVQIHYVIVNYLYVLLMALRKHILELLNLRINILLTALMQIAQSFLLTIKFNQSDFSFENAMQDLLVANNSNFSNKDSKISSYGKHDNHTLSTLKQIYSMCKQFPPNYSYGNEKIGRMILDDRTAYWYPKGVFGFKIIESCVKGRFYDNDKNEIYLVAPIANPNYHFILSIPDINLYRK